MKNVGKISRRGSQRKKKLKPLPPTCKVHNVNKQHDYVYIQYNYVNIEDDDVNMQLTYVACQYGSVAS